MPQQTEAKPLTIAVLIPCYNEAAAIEATINGFKAALPPAQIYVYDNNSQDETAEKARLAGAIVRREERQGKGHVVRRMFADIEADIYILVDGDNTYDASAAPALVQKIKEGPYDFVNVARVMLEEKEWRAGHAFGNRLLTGLVAFIFGRASQDMLSGYKAFSRRFVKSFPALSGGFEIETELMVHTLQMHIPFAEINAPYRARMEGSFSKLRTFADGWRILNLIALMIKEERPKLFFSVLSAMLAGLSLALGLPIILEFMATQQVPRFPSAILATGLMIGAGLSLFSGLILSSVARGRQESKKLAYLSLPAIHQ